MMMMGTHNDMLQLTEARYQLALRRLGLRLALILGTSIAAQAVAQFFTGN